MSLSIFRRSAGAHTFHEGNIYICGETIRPPAVGVNGIIAMDKKSLE